MICLRELRPGLTQALVIPRYLEFYSNQEQLYDEFNEHLIRNQRIYVSAVLYLKYLHLHSWLKGQGVGVLWSGIAISFLGVKFCYLETKQFWSFYEAQVKKSMWIYFLVPTTMGSISVYLFRSRWKNSTQKVPPMLAKLRQNNSVKESYLNEGQKDEY